LEPFAQNLQLLPFTDETIAIFLTGYSSTP